MNDFEQKIIISIKKMVYEAEERAYHLGRTTDYETIPYMTDEYFEYTLEDNGSSITFLIYDMTEEQDYQIQIILADNLHKEQIINFESDIEKFSKVASVLINHYILTNWIEVMAEIEVVGVPKFVEPYHDKTYPI